MTGPVSEDLTRRRKILIYGVTGSGKSTLARRLSNHVGIPWHSVDDLSFGPDWTAIPPETVKGRIAEIVAGESWILDSAYSKWLDVVLEREPLILALDYPRYVSFGRLLRRTLSRVVTREPVCNGNVESWRLALSRDSILLWHFRSFRSKRARIHAWRDAGKEVVVFRSPAEVEQWLARLSP